MNLARTFNIILLTALVCASAALLPQAADASDTGFKAAGTVESAGQWSTFTTIRLSASDNNDAICESSLECDSAAETGRISDFTFGIPAGATIDGIEVTIEAVCSNGFIDDCPGGAGDTVTAALSWDDGSTWTSTKTSSELAITDTTQTLGGAADTWGRSWTSADFANGTFQARIGAHCNPGSCDFSGGTTEIIMDYVQIKVYYTAGASRSALSKPPNNLGLVGYWSFNEGTGTIATDFSGNGRSGALIGASGSETVAFLTSGSSWSVPSDWNSTNNTIECIGGGGGGSRTTDFTNPGGGGGGGAAYSKVTNQAYTPSASRTYAIGDGGAGATASNTAGGTGGDTSIMQDDNSTPACLAKGGTGGLANGGGGTGGAAASGTGATKQSGGNGGSGSVGLGVAGGGGGGAAGPNGDGKNGGDNASGNWGGGGGGAANNGSAGAAGSGSTGGAGGNGRGGTGGGTAGGGDATAGTGGGGGGGTGPTSQAGGTGAQDTISAWVQTSDAATAGPSGGGGGGAGRPANPNGAGGASTVGYGGGGGGSGGDNDAAHSNGGDARPGIIVITYTPPSGSTPAWASGKRGRALDFDGSGSYINVGDVGSGVKTIAFWMKADDTTSRKVINIDGTDQIELNGSSQVTATSFPAATVYVDGSTASAVVDSGWHFVVITDSTGVNASTFEIGRVASGYFDGKIDDLRIYTRELSAAEIQKLYQSGAVKFTTSSVALQQGSSLANGIVGHWTFDGPDVTTVVADRSGNSNNGYFIGGATSSAKTIGKLGQALAFNGVTNNVNMGDVIEPAAFSLATWVKTRQSGVNFVGLLDKYTGSAAGYLLDLPSGTNMFPRVVARTDQAPTTGQTVTGTISVNDGAWHHIVGTYDGANCKVFIDGALNNSAGCTGTMVYDGESLKIGGDGVSTNFLNGTLDDARIYSRALTAAEVKQLYNLGQATIRQ